MDSNLGCGRTLGSIKLRVLQGRCALASKHLYVLFRQYASRVEATNVSDELFVKIVPLVHSFMPGAVASLRSACCIPL